MDATTNALNWFEISVTDIARAKKFYEAVFAVEMVDMEMMGMKMAMFPGDPMSGKVGGAIVESEYHKPECRRRQNLPECKPRPGRCYGPC